MACLISSDGNFSVVHMSSQLMLQKTLTKDYNIDVDHIILSSEYDYARGRNCIAAKFLSKSPTYTHLLFLNSSVAFNTKSIIRLLDVDLPVVGIPSPKIGYDWTKGSNFVNNNDQLITANELHAHCSSFQFNYSENKRLINGCLNVKHVGMDMTLMKREVFTKMKKEYRDLKYSDDTDSLNVEDDKN